MAVIDVPDDLYEALSAESKQSHGGDVAGLLRSSLSFWSRLTNPLGLPLQMDQPPDARPDLAVLRQLMAESAVSVDTVAGLGRTFGDAAGLLFEGRRQPAANYLRPYFAWLGDAPGDRALFATLITIQASPGTRGDERPGVVSSAQGYLQGNGITVKGSLRHTFSDRSTPDGQGFDIKHPDDLGVELTLSPEDSGFCDLTLIANSWGATRQTLRDPETLGGVLVARGDSIGSQVPEALYGLSLATFRVPG
jgi:hypothetical protein